MKSSLEEYYSDDDVEILKTGSTAVIRNKSNNHYFQVQVDSLPTNIIWAPVVPHIKRTIFIAYTVIWIIAFAYLLYQYTNSYKSSLSQLVKPVGLLLFFGYSLVSVVCHEYSHILALKYCKANIDKVGMKMNYGVFPAFYVRMNKVYLLPKRDRIVVHSAGLFANVCLGAGTILINNIFFQNAVLFSAVNIFTYGIIWNLLPILKSDGQKILFTILGEAQPRHVHDYGKVAQIINVVSWFVAIYSASMLVFDIWRHFV